jgi:hypothetical protein
MGQSSIGRLKDVLRLVITDGDVFSDPLDRIVGHLDTGPPTGHSDVVWPRPTGSKGELGLAKDKL